ncbi:MAG: PAS domain S-box protein [Candidatus Tectomicrobia bacterium]|uniref:histidine kinase n=1 Tax=Tectimicrobiota bacterium TaxID=2528274 RepID=A0A932LZV9_UNCTE|nr:PAS domain S-box protein [Candidatus Tectomicrobia bacterium]
MSPPQTPLQDRDFLFKVKVLMALRVLVLTLFLGAVIVFQIKTRQSASLLPISMLIAVTYFLTLLYALMLGRVKSLKLFCYLQIAGDILIETGIVHITGGVESVFSFLYIFSIISAAIILYRPGSYTIASLASILYGLLTNLELRQLLPSVYFHSQVDTFVEGEYALYKVSLNIVAFFLVAFLSGYLAEKVRSTREELEKKSENLLELQEFHENIVKSMNSGLMTLNGSGQIVTCNHEAEQICGYPIEKIRGMLCPDLFPDFPWHRILLREPIGVTINRHEGWFNRRDGQRIYLEMRLSPLKDEKGIVKGTILLFQDATELKALELQVKRSEKLAAVGRLAAGIAHEIRNPLGSLSGSVQVLQSELELDETNRRLMEIVVKETNRLDSIVTQFLSYARPQPLQIANYEINRLIRDSLTLLQNHEHYKDTVLIETRFEEPGLMAAVDPQSFQQVLWNLFLNALQAMPSGGTLRVETATLSPKASGFRSPNPEDGRSAGLCQITVEDSGEGIPPEALDKVFDPFFTTKDQGTGLGLALVHKIIEEHQGEITVESMGGKGTTFRIVLPAAKQLALSAQQSALQEGSAA